MKKEKSISQPEVGPNGRANVIRKIILAGKDVMTTKPFETAPDAAAAVLAEARSLGRVIHLNSPAPQPPEDLAAIVRWRGEHSLGRPVGAYCSVYANYRKSNDGTWYDDPALCPVAPILRLGIYMINDLVSFFGRAASVCVQESRIFTKRPTSDNNVLTIRFESGALATVYASFCVRDGNAWLNQLQIHFENGTAIRNTGTALRHGEGTEMGLIQAADDANCSVNSTRVEKIMAKTSSGYYDWNGFAAAVRREPGAPSYANNDLVVEPNRRHHNTHKCMDNPLGWFHVLYDYVTKKWNTVYFCRIPRPSFICLCFRHTRRRSSFPCLQAAFCSFKNDEHTYQYVRAIVRAICI